MEIEGIGKISESCIMKLLDLIFRKLKSYLRFQFLVGIGVSPIFGFRPSTGINTSGVLHSLMTHNKVALSQSIARGP